ncbi:hypothetical protein [Maribacter sp. HTCC2170]|nr:hypothetical protein [Maribacter sp. HTCC2170]EAQ99618.1 hypothetical protein FB2170_00145 [Maribacter sp. HTCC2170]
MKTIKSNLIALSTIRMQEGSYGKIKRTYPKPNFEMGFFEALSITK